MEGTLHLKTIFCTLFISASFALTAQMTLTIVPDSTCGKDAFIWFLENQQTVNGPTDTLNYGSEPYLTVAESIWSGSPGRRHVLIDFTELQNLPPGSTIESATLALFYGPGSDLGFHRGVPNNAATISRITEAWNENNVTWNNQPATSTQNQVTIPGATEQTQSFNNIDITALVRDYINDVNSNGFLLQMQNNQPDRSLNFASSDHPDPSLRPRLVIKYTPPANAVGDYREIFEEETMVVPAPCDDEPFPTVTLDAQRFGGEYIWQDGSTASSLEVDRTGQYWVDVRLPDCQILSDTIRVIFDAECCRLIMPNAFTPNGDGRNDTFLPVKPENCMITEFEMQVFNRWGKMVFSSNDPDNAWDGRDGSNTAPSDVYVFWLKYKAIGNNNEFDQTLKGDVTLIR